MIGVVIDSLKSERKLLFSAGGHYPLVEDKRPVSNWDCYLIKSSAEKTSRGNILRIKISKLSVTKISQTTPAAFFVSMVCETRPRGVVHSKRGELRTCSNIKAKSSVLKSLRDHFAWACWCWC